MLSTKMTMQMMTMVPASLARLPQLVIIIVLVFCVSYNNCDTIHFTNSPSYLITKKNFSTYKLDVPGSEPITIFEEAKKFGKRTNQYVPPPTFVTSKKQMTAYQSDEDLDGRYSRPMVQYGGEDNKHMISRYGSVERLPDQQHTVHVSASLPMTIISPDTPPSSPYSSDLPSNIQNHDDPDDENVSKTTVYSPILLDKFLKDYADKLKNADSFTKEKLYEIAKITENKQLPKPIEPSPTPVDRNDNTADDDKSQQQQKKSYPYNRPSYGGSGSGSGGAGNNGGWVTLDPVPWSTSKISKWQSNKQTSYPPSRPYPDDDYYHRPERPERPERPDRPDRPYGPSFIDEESDNFYNRPSNQQHSGNYGGFIKPDYEPVRPIYDRPKPIDPDYQYLQRPSNNNNNYDRPSSWVDDDRKVVNNGGYGSTSHNSYPHRPWQDELIIDDGPINFPSSKYPPKRHDYYSTEKRHPGAYPASHPSNGNGEWVLISTTKGYQFPPKRHGQRAMSLAPASVSAHKSVKLTVLSSNKTDKYGNRIPATTSHNGMLEVDSSTQTMEEAVLNDQYPTKPTRSKKKPLKKLAFTSKSNAQDSGAIMAAIGAGMVPATMALIAPMVLGKRRRRRSIEMPSGAELNVTFVPYTDYESSIQKNYVN